MTPTPNPAWERLSARDYLHGLRSPIVTASYEDGADEYRIEVVRCEAGRWTIFVQSRYVDTLWDTRGPWRGYGVPELRQRFTSAAVDAARVIAEPTTYGQAVACARRIYRMIVADADREVTSC